MNATQNFSGRYADSLPPPDGLDRYAVLRALDKERLRAEAPDLPLERIERIVRIRDELRRDIFESPERLETAILRAAADMRRRARLS